MGSRGAELDDQTSVDSTPEDVAALYSWANMRGAKYRDYSASRREQRAQVRYRAAKALLERELAAQTEAEAAAAKAEQEAFIAEAIVLSQSGPVNHPSRLQSLHSAEAAVRKANEERVEAARRAEAAAHATVTALREEREIAQAHVSAKEQAMMYTESELRRRQLAGPQPHFPLPPNRGGVPVLPDELPAQGSDGPLAAFDLPMQTTLFHAEDDPVPMEWPLQRRSQILSRTADASNIGPPTNRPAWLSQTAPAGKMDVAQASDYNGTEVSQQERDPAALPWLVLDRIFGDAVPAPVLDPVAGERRASLLAVFSLAGGVGKTSMVATLGRALSLRGEKVTLTDATSQGVLPYYFGARDLRPGVVRSFAPPNSGGEPISIVVYDAAEDVQGPSQQRLLAEEMLRTGSGSHRLLLDVAWRSSWVIRSLADLHPIVLVPIAPNMNSVISLQAVEHLFRGMLDADGQALKPFYVLNHFDAEVPLHLNVREVFRRQLGGRLLRISIRPSAAISEALAAGMTVLDYAPAAPVSEDFTDLAAWLSAISPPVLSEVRSLRWGHP